MSAISESGAARAGPSAYHVMESDLKPWELYSLDGAEAADNLDVMKEYFTRYRKIRGKGTNFAYTHDTLQRSWCAFIRRWNAARREGLSFTSWLENREATRSTHVIGDLRTRICELAEREWRLCYVHLVEGCSRCGGDRQRPSREEWERQLDRWPLTEDERRWIGRFDRARSNVAAARVRGGGRRGVRRSSHPRGRSRSRSRGRDPRDRQCER
jgi:hypothetical protein